jgi:hypothetical protein
MRLREGKIPTCEGGIPPPKETWTQGHAILAAFFSNRKNYNNYNVRIVRTVRTVRM